jgi:integral membrane protein (TIGR01906 family)
MASIPVALATTNIRVAANEPRLYDYSIERYDAPAVADIPQEDLERANRDLIRYFNDDDQRFVRVVVRDTEGREISLFNPRETAHLADVKNLFQKVFFVQEASLIYALAFVVLAFIWAAEAPLRSLATSLLVGSALTAGLVAVAGLVALVGFDDVWLRFHFLAFANDLWRLDPATDHLIQMFPRDFWLDATLLVGGSTALEALALAGLSGLYLYCTRPLAQVETEWTSATPERAPRDGLPR